MNVTMLDDADLQTLKERVSRRLRLLTRLEQAIQDEEWARHVAANDNEVAS